MDAQALIKRAEQTHRLTENEIVHILQDEAADAALFSAADRVRKKYVGDEVHFARIDRIYQYLPQRLFILRFARPKQPRNALPHDAAANPHPGAKGRAGRL